MTELFTIKLDLSGIAGNGYDAGYDAYILLIDPRKMKLIYDFTEWIRFLFSLKTVVQLIYEGSAIHYLEDIKILSLLKSVEVKSCSPVCPDGTPMQASILEKVNRYNEWNGIQMGLSTRMKTTCEKSVQTIIINENLSTNLQYKEKKLAIEDNFKNSHYSMNNITFIQKNVSSQNENEDCVYHHLNSHEESLPNVILDSQHRLSADKENNIYVSGEIINNPDSFQTFKCRVSRTNGNGKSARVDESQNDGKNKFTQNNDLNASKYEIQETVEFSTLNRIEKPKNGNQRANTIKKKKFTKPFCVSDALNMLRSDPAYNTDNVQSQPIDQSGSVEGFSNIDETQHDSEEEDDQPYKKRRKRIRKHKSKKNSCAYDSFSLEKSMSLFQNITKAESPSSYPKHIRFNAEEADLEQTLYDSNTDGAVNDKNLASDEHQVMTNVNDGEGLNVKVLTDLLEQKRNALQSSLHNDSKNDKFLESSDTSKDVTGLCRETLSESGILETENNSALKDGSLSDSPMNILHDLGTLRQRFSVPIVFNRFS